MSNTDLVTRYDKLTAVQQAKAQGYSQSKAAAHLGWNIGTIKKYWNKTAPSHNPAKVISAALDLKRDDTHSHRGPMQLSALVDGIGTIVSETTLSRHIKDAGLSMRKTRWRGGSRPYWMEAKPSQAGDMFQGDTVKLRTADGILHEVFSIADVVSGVHHLSFVAHGNLSGCLQDAFDHMGICKVLQMDNGFGMISNADGRLSAFQRVAAANGIKRIHYIPEGDPDRNAAVESFHGWLQLEYVHHGMCTDRDALALWLTNRLDFWNFRKPLSSLGGKGKRRTPAQVGTYQPGNVTTPPPASVTSSYPTGMTISYTRLIDGRGAFVVKNPGLVVILGEDLAGHYARCDISPDGSARFLVRFAADEGERITVEKVCGRLISDYDGQNTHEVATAKLEWSDAGSSRRAWLYAAERAELDRNVTPIRFDPQAAARHYAKTLRKPMPASYPKHVDVITNSDGSWHWVDLRTGDMIASELCVPDHSREI